MPVYCSCAGGFALTIHTKVGLPSQATLLPFVPCPHLLCLHAGASSGPGSH